MTVERGQEAQPLDPLASQRIELVGQLAAAQLALETTIAELTRSGGDSAILAAGQLQLSAVSSLLRQVGSASLSRLAELRGEVAATAASAIALVNQATGNAGTSAAANTNLTPAQRARATIEAAGRDLFDKHVLDASLEFSSPEDEEAYRKREREREAAFDREKSKQTTDGDRRAHAILQSQVADAKAHGADRSPELPAIERELGEAEQDLRASSRPLPKQVASADAGATPTAKAGDGIADVMAALRAAGVEHDAGRTPVGGHGVTKIAAASTATLNPVGRG